MSLQAITKKIQAEAAAEVSDLKIVTDKKCVEIADETARQKTAIETSLQANLEKQQEHRRSVVQSLEKQRSSMALQSVKRRLLDEVYEQAFEKLLALSAKEYVEVLVKRYETLVPKDTKVTSIVAPEARLKETEDVSKELGWKASVAADSKLKGGCILKGDDFEYDLSLSRLFAEDRTSTETEIANTLFQTAK
jgi:vacuolar-type H+-ATPase subunit E/Vma4